jgi:hypothetical protein
MQSSTNDNTNVRDELHKFQQDLMKLEQEQDKLQKTGQPQASYTKIRIQELLNHGPTATESRSGGRNNE